MSPTPAQRPTAQEILDEPCVRALLNKRRASSLGKRVVGAATAIRRSATAVWDNVRKMMPTPGRALSFDSSFSSAGDSPDGDRSIGADVSPIRDDDVDADDDLLLLPLLLLLLVVGVDEKLNVGRRGAVDEAGKARTDDHVHVAHKELRRARRRLDRPCAAESAMHGKHLPLPRGWARDGPARVDELDEHAHGVGRRLDLARLELAVEHGRKVDRDALVLLALAEQLRAQPVGGNGAPARRQRGNDENAVRLDALAVHAQLGSLVPLRGRRDNDRAVKGRQPRGHRQRKVDVVRPRNVRVEPGNGRGHPAEFPRDVGGNALKRKRR